MQEGVHRMSIDVRPGSIPILPDLEVELDDRIEFGATGGTAWVLIPGSSLAIDNVKTSKTGDEGNDDGDPGFLAFELGAGRAVTVVVVGRAPSREEQMLPYAVLCQPGSGERPYYAQGHSPPRIILPPPVEVFGDDDG